MFIVNGTVGEGFLMKKSERKEVLEAWVKAAKTHEITVMAHVGGTHFTMVQELVGALLKYLKSYFLPIGL